MTLQDPDRMRRLLVPVVLTPTRPRGDEADRLRYLRSYLVMRTMIGLIGVALPFALGLGDLVLSGRGPFTRGSLSAYYYSGARDVFVGTLYAVAVFLITYKVAEANLDNTLSLVAGTAALGVATFPTDRPDPGVTLTPLQQQFGETMVATVHYLSAAVFIGSLAVLCYFFGVREGRRPRRHDGRCSPCFWKWFHWSCAAAIAAAVLYYGISRLAGGTPRDLLVTELVSVWAFGASWLMKGLELDVLLPTRATGASSTARLSS